MDNQLGYSELNQIEIDLINQINAKGREISALVDALKASSWVDPRWVAIGATDIQKGLMALTRAVAKPEFF